MNMMNILTFTRKTTGFRSICSICQLQEILETHTPSHPWNGPPSLDVSAIPVLPASWSKETLNTLKRSCKKKEAQLNGALNWRWWSPKMVFQRLWGCIVVHTYLILMYVVLCLYSCFSTWLLKNHSSDTSVMKVCRKTANSADHAPRTIQHILIGAGRLVVAVLA